MDLEILRNSDFKEAQKTTANVTATNTVASPKNQAIETVGSVSVTFMPKTEAEKLKGMKTVASRVRLCISAACCDPFSAVVSCANPTSTALEDVH